MTEPDTAGTASTPDAACGVPPSRRRRAVAARARGDVAAHVMAG
ncbi:hypothetical protein [Streptomyces milbemycinicus]